MAIEIKHLDKPENIQVFVEEDGERIGYNEDGVYFVLPIEPVEDDFDYSDEYRERVYGRGQIEECAE